MQGVVAAARAAAPAVVFLDELDALAPARGGGAGGRGEAAGEMSARLVASLLTAMDGAGAGTPLLPWKYLQPRSCLLHQCYFI